MAIKSESDEITSLFFILQFISMLTIYKVNFPSNSLIYLQELRKMVELDMINPINIIDKISPNILGRRNGDVDMTKNLELTDIDSGRVADQMASYLLLLAVYVLYMFILKTLLRNCSNARARVHLRNQLARRNKNLYWSGVL